MVIRPRVKSTECHACLFLIFIWQETVVLRCGRRYTTPVDRLVVGDIVDVKFGDRVPADIRIIVCSGFKVVCLIN